MTGFENGRQNFERALSQKLKIPLCLEICQDFFYVDILSIPTGRFGFIHGSPGATMNPVAGPK